MCWMKCTVTVPCLAVILSVSLSLSTHTHTPGSKHTPSYPPSPRILCFTAALCLAVYEGHINHTEFAVTGCTFRGNRARENGAALWGKVQADVPRRMEGDATDLSTCPHSNFRWVTHPVTGAVSLCVCVFVLPST
jgi:hypothetical protein